MFNLVSNFPNEMKDKVAMSLCNPRYNYLVVNYLFTNKILEDELFSYFQQHSNNSKLFSLLLSIYYYNPDLYNQLYNIIKNNKTYVYLLNGIIPNDSFTITSESYDRNLVSSSLPLLPPLPEFRFSSIKLQNEDFIDTLELVKHVDVLSFYSIYIFIRLIIIVFVVIDTVICDFNSDYKTINNVDHTDILKLLTLFRKNMEVVKPFKGFSFWEVNWNEKAINQLLSIFHLMYNVTILRFISINI